MTNRNNLQGQEALRDKLIQEVDSMMMWAADKSIDVPRKLVETYWKVSKNRWQKVDKEKQNSEELVDWMTIHKQLSTLLAPASPRIINILIEEGKRSDNLRFLSPYLTLRYLIPVCLFFITSIILLGYFDVVNIESVNKSILYSGEISQGSLLLNQLFIASNAALGASISCLLLTILGLKIGDENACNLYRHFITIALGMGFGMLVAELLGAYSLYLIPENPQSFPVAGYEKPFAALLAGLSISVVLSVLARIQSLAIVDVVDRGGKIKSSSKALVKTVATKADSEKINKIQDDPIMDNISLINSKSASNDSRLEETAEKKPAKKADSKEARSAETSNHNKASSRRSRSRRK